MIKKINDLKVIFENWDLDFFDFGFSSLGFSFQNCKSSNSISNYICPVKKYKPHERQ